MAQPTKCSECKWFVPGDATEKHLWGIAIGHCIAHAPSTGGTCALPRFPRVDGNNQQVCGDAQ